MPINISHGLAKLLLEGILLNIFIRIAEKNPPQTGKDTLIVLAEKLLDVRR